MKSIIAATILTAFSLSAHAAIVCNGMRAGENYTLSEIGNKLLLKMADTSEHSHNLEMGLFMIPAKGDMVLIDMEKLNSGQEKMEDIVKKVKGNVLVVIARIKAERGMPQVDAISMIPVVKGEKEIAEAMGGAGSKTLAVGMGQLSAGLPLVLQAHGLIVSCADLDAVKAAALKASNAN